MDSSFSRLARPFQTLQTALALVFSTRAYAALALVLFPVFAVVLVHLTSIPGQSWVSWWFSQSDAAKLFVVAASVLMALAFSVQAFVWRNLRPSARQKARHAGASVGAFLTAALATACCSPLVIPVLGFTGFAYLLHAYQSSFMAFSLLLLAASLYYSAKAVACQECRVKTGLEFRPKA